MVESKENEKRTLLARINKHHVLIVVVLSVIHILLACGHSRDSGRADPPSHLSHISRPCSSLKPSGVSNLHHPHLQAHDLMPFGRIW